MSPLFPHEVEYHKSSRDSALGWFWFVNLGVGGFIVVTKPSMGPIIAAQAVGILLNIFGIYHWAKLKGQSGAWGILGLFWLPGLLIATMVLGPMQVPVEEVVPVSRASVVVTPPLVSQPSQAANTRNIPSGSKEEADDLDKRVAVLEKYAALRQKGLITEEEYNQQKKKILGL